MKMGAKDAVASTVIFLTMIASTVIFLTMIAPPYYPQWTALMWLTSVVILGIALGRRLDRIRKAQA